MTKKEELNFEQVLSEEFANKIVWVTGAGQGIGAAIAAQFTALGAQVIGFDRAFHHDSVNIYQQVYCDLNKLEQLTNILTELIQGDKAPYSLINVAGVVEYANLEETSLTQWLHCQTVNSSAVFVFLKLCMRHFKNAKQGSIVTIGSNAAATPRQGMAAYCASKSAVTQLTLTAGLELANYGVRCNVIAPGSTLTPMQTDMWSDSSAEQQVIDGFSQQYKLGIPLKKLATPEEVANSVVFFASNLASHTTMQTITIDGGATI